MRLTESSLRCRCTLLPLKPPKPGARPQRKEGIHVRTFSMHYGASLAGLLLPRPWTLKTSRPQAAPRGFPVSHSPEVPWDMQLAPFSCSLRSLPYRLIQAEGHTRTPTCAFLVCLHCQGGRLEVPGGMPLSHPVSPRMPVVLQVQLTLARLVFCVAVCATLR